MFLQEINPLVTGATIAGVIIIFLFIVFMATRYRKFKTNQFVIHLRNGKVKHAGLGGSIWLLPLIDEYIVIPTTSIQTILEAHDQVVSKEYQNIEVVGMLIWKVVDPENVGQIADRTLKLLSDAPRRKEYGRRNRESVMEIANMDVEMGKLESLYKGLVNK